MGYEAQNTDEYNTMSEHTETLGNDMDTRYGPRINHKRLRPRHKLIYSNPSLNIVSHESEDEMLHYTMRKHSIMKGLGIFVESGIITY